MSERIDSVVTITDISLMAQLHPTTPTERSPSDPKGSINLRIGADTRQLIDDAAALLGKTRTEFMIETARREAIDVLLDQRLFVLDSERYDSFVKALDNPPAPGPKLRALLKRKPAWATEPQS